MTSSPNKTLDVDVQTPIIGVYDRRSVSGSKYAMSGLFTALEARKESYAAQAKTGCGWKDSPYRGALLSHSCKQFKALAQADENG